MLSYTAASLSPPPSAWRLLAEPARWKRWAPHIRGAWGLGEVEVQPGRRGVVLLAPRIPVPVRIIAKQPGRWWEWQVGPLQMRHAVHRERDGCRIEVTLRGPGPAELAAHAAYGPIIWLTVNNLARVAGRP